MSKEGKSLTQENIDAINAILSKDQRVEVVPTKDGVRVFHVKREEVKVNIPRHKRLAGRTESG